MKNCPPGESEVTSAHEYRSLDYRKASDQVTVTIDDRGGGGSKDDKFGRDISLLTKELEREPDNERYMFHLAEFYRHGKRYRSAIEWYRKGIDRGGWQEETWYARYMIGACHEALGELPEATAAYLDAYIDRPARAEPLHDLARLWRLKGIRAWAISSPSVPAKFLPTGDVLFINPTAHRSRTISRLG